MKTFVALLLCVAATPAAWAAAKSPGTTDEARSWAQVGKMPPMKVMHMIDTDNKGYVTKEEFQAFTEKLYEQMDKNHDGKVDKDEWMGAVKSAKAKAAEDAGTGSTGSSTPPDTQQ
jgi:hypothetical protein